MKAQDNSKGWPEGWLVAAAAAVLAAVMARVVGEVGLFAAFMIAVFVFLVFGVLLGMFWGVPVTAAPGGHGAAGHGSAGHGAGHGHDHAPVARTAPLSPPVATGLAEHGALDGMAAEPMVPTLTPAPAPDPVPAAAPPEVTEAVMERPVVPASVAQPLMAQPAPPVAEAVAEPAFGAGSKPVGLTSPRGGVADRLQVIEGIGPVLEKLCHDLGIYHFDQIAGRGPAQVAWMDGNLKGFKGRVTRDKWVRQAALISEVGLEEFQRRAKLNDY